jgi:hypothetical protein
MSKRKARATAAYTGDIARMLADRIGRTPVERLGWVIRFAQADLSALRPEERLALAKDLSLLQEGVTIENPRPLPDLVLLKDSQISDAVLRSIQQEMAEGLRGLLDGKPWPVPNAKKLYVYPSQPEKAGGPQFKMVWFGSGGPKEAVLNTMARLLVDHGAKVRACPDCGRIFIATRRQEYCSAQCSQRVRNYRRKLAEKEG